MSLILWIRWSPVSLSNWLILDISTCCMRGFVDSFTFISIACNTKSAFAKSSLQKLLLRSQFKVSSDRQELSSALSLTFLSTELEMASNLWPCTWSSHLDFQSLKDSFRFTPRTRQDTSLQPWAIRGLPLNWHPQFNNQESNWTLNYFKKNSPTQYFWFNYRPF